MRRILLTLLVLPGLLAAGCATAPPPAPPPPAPPAGPPPGMRETPPPDGVWRPHLLARCRQPEAPPPADAAALAEAWGLFEAGEGDDAIVSLETYLRRHEAGGLLLMTLGQLYLLAGQGTPGLLPRQGPAADVGDWQRNQKRLLARAAQLLQEATRLRPDDGVVEYLLADVARTAGDLEQAARAERAGSVKCSLPESLELLRSYQGLTLHAARLESDIVPEYPPAAVERGAQGEVVSDLLISPAGEAAQVVAVQPVDPDLAQAAAVALRAARYRPAKVGKYPIWSWLRVSVRFSLTSGDEQTGG